MTTRASPVQPHFLAASIGSAIFLSVSATYGQAPQAPVVDGRAPPGGPQSLAPVDPQSLSCNDLKAQLKSTGEMQILVGPRGGSGDTFFGPAVPRCQFWQRPQFAYVRARDGLCGVGYICVDKYSMD